MSTCKFCGADNLTWHENLGKLVSEITGKQHSFKECTPNKIPLYCEENKVFYPRREERIAGDITNEAVRLGINPYRVEIVRDGDFLVIKR